MSESVATDAGSLLNLHDIIAPEAVSFWPPAAGWLAAGVLLLSFLIPWLIALMQHYRMNRYRRTALSELRSIEKINDKRQQLDQLLGLLKRTAMTVYPRERVASLSGEAWWTFLTQSSGVEFSSSTRKLCGELFYNPAHELVSVEAEQPCKQFVQEIKAWIHKHKVEALQSEQIDDI